MANVLTDLANDLFKAADTIGRELVGLIPSCTINADGSQEAAVGDVVRSHFTREASTVTRTPSMTIPEGTDQTVDSKTLTITKEKSVQIPWTGEDMKHVNNGAGFETIYGDQIMQAMRTLANEIEADLATEAYKNASRAFGTAGTTPFASNFNDIAEMRKILVDNGMPINDGRTSLVLNTAASTNLRQLAQLQKANEAGNDRLLRQGELLSLQGLMLKESAGIQSHTKGTGASYQVAASGGYAEDAYEIDVDTGSGTILAGDVITFDGDTNKYVVNTALSGGTLSLGTPGLREAAADNAAITVGASYAGNIAFHQAALELAIRAPANPIGGDAAVDVMTIQDPWSGLIFQISAYKGYRKAMFDVGATWGYKAWKPDFIALLLG